jgi:predicted Zn-dependent protease
MIRMWRDMLRKTDLFAIGAMVAGVAGGATGVNTGDITQLAQLGTILSLFRYSRTMEAEADAMGARLLAENGYPAIEMSNTWEQLIGEEVASARHRRKRRRRHGGLFETHPSPESRLADLKVSAAEVTVPGRTYDSRRGRYLQAISPIRKMLLDDQVKLNDPGASQYLIETLARDGWNGLLRFYEAEVWRLRNRRGDDQRAAAGYAIAVAYPDAPPEAWRWHGLSLIKSGRQAEGRTALSRYLSMQPNAADAPFIRQMIS